MGLKDPQTLALICHATEAGPALPPFLIVAPTSVVANWASEAARFAPGSPWSLTDTLRRQAGPRRRDRRRRRRDHLVHPGSGSTPTRTRPRALGRPGARRGPVRQNHQSKVHQCARKLPAPPFKLAITGTPRWRTT
ncbi:hypothetical protein HBB16_08550 [Pseudonocardia sp. MCCB 268]|nr:hypothetical protein [Pseudonocardia cytotoxica]